MLAVLLAACCQSLQSPPDPPALPPLHIEGFVLGCDRKPVPNCEVWTGDDGPPAVPARTDASGMFALVAERAVELAIHARLPGIGLGRITTPGLGAMPCRVRIELLPVRTIRGTVATIGGAPVAGAWVTASADEADVGGTATRSDAQGRWQLDASTAGTTTIRATMAGLGSAFAVDDGTGADIAIEIDPDDARQLTVAVRGVPTPCRLRLHAESARAVAVPLPAELACPTLGPDGRIAIRGLPHRSRVFVVAESGSGAMRCDFMPTDVREWTTELRCDDAMVLAGTVRDADGRPIADLPLAAWSPEANWQRPTLCRSARDGTWRMPSPVPAGAALRLAVADPGRRVPTEARLSFDPARRYDLCVRRTATVRGRVLDERGAPVTAVQVWLYASTVSCGLTGSDGHFELQCPPGVETDVRLLVSEPAGCGSLVLSLGDAPDLDAGTLVLERGATIRGVARAADGSPLRHQRVQLHDLDRGGERRVFTDDAGGWAFTGLPAGSFHVSDAGQRRWRRVEVGDGGGQVIDLGRL